MSDFWQGFIVTGLIILVPFVAFQWWKHRHRAGTFTPPDLLDLLLDDRPQLVVRFLHARSGAEMTLYGLTERDVKDARRASETRPGEPDMRRFHVEVVRRSWQCVPPASNEFIRQCFTIREVMEISERVLELSGFTEPSHA